MKNDNFNSAVPSIERAIGYTFRDKGLLRQAFTRSSWCNEHPRGGYQSNEVLEFFGDSVLSVAIITFLLSAQAERCEHGIRTELGEGDFSNIKSKLSDKTNLSASMAKLGLEKHLLLGEGDAKLGISSEPSVMEDLFESIVGAVYIDSDKSLDMVTKVVTKMLDMSVYSDSSAASVSPKNALQEWCADKKRRLPPPVYRTVSESGPDHKKEYERGVYVSERLLATAIGKNQKTADALAAKEALQLLMKEADEASKPAAPTESKKASAAQKKHAENSKTAQSGHTSAQTAREKSEPGIKASAQQEKSDRSKVRTRDTSAKGPEAAPNTQARGEAVKSGRAESADKAKAASGKDGKVENVGKVKNADKSQAVSGKDGNKKVLKAKPKSALSASALLRAHAVKMSVAGPVFRDLGVIDKDEHGVECSFMGQRAIATAPTRPEAKEKAAESIRDALKLK